MALKFVNQISCTICKPKALTNVGALRRIQSLSSFRESNSEETRSNTNKTILKQHERRTKSQPPFCSKIHERYFQTGNAVLKKDETAREYFEEETDEVESEQLSYNILDRMSDTYKNKNTRKTVKLQPKYLTPYCDRGIRTDSSIEVDNLEEGRKAEEKVINEIRVKASKAYKKAVKKINKKAEEESHRYRVDCAKPKVDKGGRVFDVFKEYRTSYYAQKSRMPSHLQPQKIKPFGAINDIIEHPYRKKMSIVFPETDDTFNVVEEPNEERNIASSAKEQNSKINIQQRDYSTQNNNDHIKEINKIITEQRLLNGKYNQADLKQAAVQSKDSKDVVLVKNVEHETETRKDISDYPQSRKHFVGTINRNEGLGSGSLFSKRQLTNEEEDVKESETTKEEEETANDLGEQDKHKKYCFNTYTKLDLPDIEYTPVTIKVGPKLNLLQSAASPDVVLKEDKIVLGENERLGVPWPSYSDRLKISLMPKQDIIIAPENTVPCDGQITATEGNDYVHIQKRNFCSMAKKTQKKTPITKKATGSDLHNILELWKMKHEINKTADYNMNTWYKKKNVPKLAPYLKRKFSTNSKHGLLGPEGTVMPKLCRLPKMKIKEPERTCPAEEDQCNMPRADDKLKIKPKKLPTLKAAECPCVEETMQDHPELPRLKKKHIPDPERVCKEIKEECPPRADDNLVISPKTLPCIEPKECPCVEKEFKDVEFARLKKKHVEEPPRVCKVECVGDECCPPRADASLKVKKKTLPIMKPTDCPCVENEIYDVPPLQRLQKVKIPEPDRSCPKEELECSMPRADENYNPKKKTLPTMPCGDCICKDPEIPIIDPGLARLKKVPISEPPKICPVEEECTIPRADEGLKIKSKKLPKLKPTDCPCVEHIIPDQPDCLPRLKMKPVPEPVRVCPKTKEECPPRADDDMKIKPKILPPIVAKECPCVEKEFKDVEFARLKKKHVEEPPRVCDVECVGDECCPPRADAKLKVKKKALPIMKPADCPCVENEIFDVPPLQRLQKVNIPEPIRMCPKIEDECSMPRADENYVMKKKSLPSMPCGDCNCKNPPAATVDPGLSRLKKVAIPEPPKMCPPVEEECSTPRADEKLKIKNKKLPKLKPTDCPCVEHEIPDQPDCLPRLKKKHIPDPVRVCPKIAEECPPRADDNMVVTPKTLPYIEPKECPCVDMKWKDVEFARLQKKQVEEPPRVCQVECVGDECCPPRADAKLKIKKKKLPIMKPAECPCVEQPMKDCKPLARLNKVDIKEPEKICKTEEFECPPRADTNCTYKKKCLPTMILCEKNNEVSINQFNKSKTKVDKRSKRKFNTHSKQKVGFPSKNFFLANRSQIESNVRMYSNFQIKNMEYTVAPKLCRLKKREGYVEEDIKHDKSHCEIPSSTCDRLDEILKYKVKRKQLPKLFAGKCPGYTADINVGEETLPRLKKRYKYDNIKLNMNEKENTITKADDKLKETKESIPIISASDYPCVSSMANFVPTVPQFPKIEQSDIDWASLKKCKDEVLCDPIRTESSLKESKKSKLKHYPFTDLKDMTPCLKRLPKVKQADINWQAIKHCIPEDTIIPRADWNALDKIYRKRKLPCLLPPLSKMHYSTGLLRKNKNSNLQFSRNISTNSVSYQLTKKSCQPPKSKCKKEEKPKVAEKPKKKECVKLGKQSTKSGCPTFSLPGCPPKVKRRCDAGWIDVPCTKQNSPYPSFSECKDEDYEKGISECIFQDRYLQPCWPILKDIDTQKAPPPHQGQIDPSKEEECVYKKLGIKKTGETKDCSNFNETCAPIRAKDMLPPEENITEFPENESKPGVDGECPVVVTDECQNIQPKKLVCEPAPKEAMEECIRRKRPKVQAVPVKKSLWERICDYFRARPNCPAPDEWKKKKLREKAEQAAAAAGLEICEKSTLECIDEEPVQKKQEAANKKSSDEICKSVKPLKCEGGSKADDAPKIKCKKLKNPKQISCECNESGAEGQQAENIKKQPPKAATAAATAKVAETAASESVRAASETAAESGGKSDKRKHAETCGKPVPSCSQEEDNRRCKNFKVNCPPRARYTCEINPELPPCTPVESPYPSFTDCDVAFPRLAQNECTVQDEIIKTKHIDYSNVRDQAKKSGSSKQNNKGKRTTRKKYSTLAAQRRFYSSNSNNSKPKDPLEFFENINSETLKEIDQKELALKILAAVKEGMKILESTGQIDKKNPYYAIYKELEVLSENELHNTTMKNSINLINRETLLNMLPPSNAMDVDDKFVGIRQLWKNLPTNDYSILNYEESEKIKTENLQKRLDKILEGLGNLNT